MVYIVLNIRIFRKDGIKVNGCNIDQVNYAYDKGRVPSKLQRLTMRRDLIENASRI